MGFILVTSHARQRNVLVALRFMARLALDARVQALQREDCLVVVEEHSLFPAGFVVAATTTWPQRSPVHVVRFMTAHARCPHLVLIDVALVTGRAAQRCMRFAQRPLGIARVVEANFRPRLENVAALALGLVSTGVNVLDFVASVTGLGRAVVVFVIMALGAGDVLVSIFERIGRLSVIEGCCVNPAFLGVTGFAVLAKRAAMTVGILVAAEAVGWCLGIFTLCVAPCALQTYVAA